MKKMTQNQQRSTFLTLPRKLGTVRHLSDYVQAVNHVLLRKRILSAITISSFFWLVSLSLGAAHAQAQESPSDECGMSVTEGAIAQPSTPTTEANRVVLSMVDRSELEARALPKSAIEPANTKSTYGHRAEKLLLPSNPRGSEYASLAALASAPSSALLNALEGKNSGHAAPPVPVNKTLVYQLGSINFVINGLSNSFSVSSAGTGAAVSR